jgi:glycosidase
VARISASATIYEINTAAWLQRLGQTLGHPVGLGDVPTAEWGALADLPVDAVWLMGVWQRSPVGRTIAASMPQLVGAYRAVLDDLREDDVLGSPYCVHDYVVDERFGGPDGLAVAREQLDQRGIGLILDYVPNHVAVDHPWVTDRPDCFLAGTEEELAQRPEAFSRTASGVYAKGRDPYFEPWQDVLQLNAFSPQLRRAAADTMATIADQCDGVRCDMAMLMTNEVFARTWGERPGPAPELEYWPALIEGCRQAHPDLLFMAEVYWDMEWALQQQGFDLCYDKRLYDRLVHHSAESVRDHLRAEADYQQHLVRFIENHDEPRAAATFGAVRERAAAVVMSTLQGARLYHDGQLDGALTHLPVQLGRGPAETSDAQLRAFYGRLLRAVSEAQIGSGEWDLCECTTWLDDSYHPLVAWSWSHAQARHLVVVNLSDGRAEGRVWLPWDDLTGWTWRLTDRLGAGSVDHSGDELARSGLGVALDGWEARLLAVERA